MRSLLLVGLMALASLQAFNTVHADVGVVFVQSTDFPSETGDPYFSTNYVYVRLDLSGWGFLAVRAGDQAFGNFVLSTNLNGNPAQSVAFDGTVPTAVALQFRATGTYWAYLAAAGTTTNYDYVQIRVIANNYMGSLSPLYSKPPVGWATGYPPAAAWMVSDPGSDSGSGALPAPSSTSSSSSSVSTWLVPLLICVVVVAVMVPLAMIAHKKWKARRVEGEGDKQPQVQTQMQPHTSVELV